jgi:hypothetical protein
MSDQISNQIIGENQPPVYDEGEVDVVVDLEECAREGKRPPRTRHGYRIRINGEPFVICSTIITGREVLLVAGLTPPEKYTLRVKVRGERPKKVGLDEKVDLTQPGVEKFVALPRDQTEG